MRTLSIGENCDAYSNSRDRPPSSRPCCLAAVRFSCTTSAVFQPTMLRWQEALRDGRLRAVDKYLLSKVASGNFNDEMGYETELPNGRQLRSSTEVVRSGK